MDKLPDSSWLKIFELKVNITAAICIASTLILYLAAHDMLYLGDLPKYIPAILALVAIFSGVITASHFIEGAISLVKKYILQRKLHIDLKKKHKEVLGFLDNLSDKKHEVLSYLVQNNQRSFNAVMTGKVVATLRQNGLVTMASGTVSVLDTPFTVPTLVWDELLIRKNELNSCDVVGPHPWRERLF